MALSVELTGFSEIELAGTGVADLYRSWLWHAFPDVFASLLSAWVTVAREPDRSREAAMRRDILAEPKLGPFARAVVCLWYTATWNALPATWTDAYGHHAEDVNQTFGAAYAEGLVWRAAGLHPGGAKPGGFGSWASAP